jgi:hypothetical protein
MKLQVSAQELLTLYHVLREQLNSSTTHDKIHLKSMYDRVHSIVLASLTNSTKLVNPNQVESWLKHEQSKIDELKQQNASIGELAKDIHQYLPSQVLTDDEGEIQGELGYPKHKKNLHNGKHRGHKK